MENGSTIFTNFGCLPCGKKTVEVVKIENKTKKTQLLVLKSKTNKSSNVTDNLCVHPLKTVVQPKQTARFTLTYTPNVENVTENYCFDVLDSEEFIARLKVHAESVGPCLSPLILNLKFYHFRDVNQTAKNIEITNKGECDAKFYFDLDEDNREIEISQRSGTINAGHKLGLKLYFNPAEPGVYYKRIFCIVQFHVPIIFNILGVHQPKLKLEPKEIRFFYPPELYSATGYEAYTTRGKVEKLSEGEKLVFFQKRFDEEKMARDVTNADECPQDKLIPSDQPSEKKHWTDSVSTEVFLTTTYIDIKNSLEVPTATALVNISDYQLYYYSWNNDPSCMFYIKPCQGFLEPKTKTHFTVCLKPPVIDSLFHAELDVKILPCNESKMSVVYLPLTINLRIIGNSFFNKKCHWLAQCKITPKALHLSSCVPNENVFGTFMIERQGHLPFTYEVVPSKEPNFIVQPSLGYLSKSFQLFVVQFSSELKEPGIYEEDLKIKFNDSDSNVETIKVFCSVETPRLVFGSDNSFTFAPIFPGSKLSDKIPIENPTNLHIRYEFKVPEDITWTEVVNPSGFIEPKSSDEVEIIFKPEVPCEYLDYIPCFVSSASKIDFIETVHLQLIGSSQFGYLVAMPSYHNFGEISYKEKKTLKITLFNFSSVMLSFRLSARGAFGNAERDVRIAPCSGRMPPKGHLEVEITVTSHEVDLFQYEILCQNFQDDSEEAKPCDDPRLILSLQFQGILPTFQITDISFHKGGPLFSPDWAWKMFSVDKINAALNRVDPGDEIKIVLPEAMKNCDPLEVHLLMEASKCGEVSCESKVDVFCPCRSEISENSSSGPSQCLHKKAVVLKRFEKKSGTKKQLVLHFKLHFRHHSHLKVQLTLGFPHNRTVTIVAPLISLSETNLGTLSFYTSSDFHLKPVFIGDPHPPVQLFWLYNNTHTDASYCLDVVALRKSTSVPGVFNCINPTGVVPPYSSTPLGFVFRPNEIITYSASTFLHVFEDESKVIHLTGEGTVEVPTLTQFALPKTIPRKTRLEFEDVSLECYENTIEVNFLHVFSESSRYFYIKNKSKTVKWAFRWHCFNVENLFTATVQPKEGTVEPSQDALMTLTLKSYAHQTFLSFSVPCDVTNYSELKAYEKSVRARDKMIEKSQDYFTITEKGISYATPDYPVSKKPEASHIFVTVNANIVTSLNIDQNLSQNQQSIMKAQSEMQSNMTLDFHLKPEILPSIQEVLEKVIWHILCSDRVANNLKILQKSHDYNYSHLLSESKTKTEESIKRLMALPEKSLIQEFLAEQMTDVLCKNLNSDIKMDEKTFDE